MLLFLLLLFLYASKKHLQQRARFWPIGQRVCVVQAIVSDAVARSSRNDTDSQDIVSSRLEMAEVILISKTLKPTESYANAC